MIIYGSSSKIKKKIKNAVVAIGNFDGVHRGHKKIFEQVLKKAKNTGGTSIAYTLFPHPSLILRPEAYEAQINSIEERLTLIENKGIQVAVVENFDHAFSKKSANQFFEEIILKNLRTKYLYVGYNFFFGRNREGNVNILKKLCQRHRIELHVMKPFRLQNESVSSSKIRRFILSGNVKKAALFLGRYFFLQGIMKRGAGRGKKIGIPTVNLETQAELIPKIGVYATLIEYNHRLYPSVTNVGHTPTFSKKSPFSIETHILDFKKETAQGDSFILHFVDRIRSTQKFPSALRLVAQIQKDISFCKDYFCHLVRPQ